MRAGQDQLHQLLSLYQKGRVRTHPTLPTPEYDKSLDFYADDLLNPHWGEIVALRPGNRLDIRMSFQGLDHQQAEALW